MPHPNPTPAFVPTALPRAPVPLLRRPVVPWVLACAAAALLLGAWVALRWGA